VINIYLKKLAGDYFAFLHVEVVDDDTNEEVESEEGAEDDEDDEVHVHVSAVLALRLLTHLYSSQRTHRRHAQTASSAQTPDRIEN